MQRLKSYFNDKQRNAQEISIEIQGKQHGMKIMQRTMLYNEKRCGYTSTSKKIFYIA